jgi:hypothetical protein
MLNGRSILGFLRERVLWARNGDRKLYSRRMAGAEALLDELGRHKSESGVRVSTRRQTIVAAFAVEFSSATPLASPPSRLIVGEQIIEKSHRNTRHDCCCGPPIQAGIWDLSASV